MGPIGKYLWSKNLMFYLDMVLKSMHNHSKIAFLTLASNRKSLARICKTWMGRSGSKTLLGILIARPMGMPTAARAIIFRSGGVVLQSLLRLPYPPLR